MLRSVKSVPLWRSWVCLPGINEADAGCMWTHMLKKARYVCDRPQMVQAAVGQLLTKTQTPSLHPDQTSTAAVMAFQSLTADI